MTDLKPCPFCGMKPPEDLSDTLYPSGIYWREDAFGRIYRSHPEREAEDQPCWSMNCTENMGGCGAEIGADSQEEACVKWNRRPASLGMGDGG